MKLYDAPRCPYCARVRIVLAEKRLDYETVEIDLSDRPRFLYDLNPAGKVPVLDNELVLPESPVIMEYLEEQYPTPQLLPTEPALRAQARLAVFRFDELLGTDYYAFRRGNPNELDQKLTTLPVGESLFADFAFVPWLIRLRELHELKLPDRVAGWLAGLEARPSVAAEVELVRAL